MHSATLMTKTDFKFDLYFVWTSLQTLSLLAMHHIQVIQQRGHLEKLQWNSTCNSSFGSSKWNITGGWTNKSVTLKVLHDPQIVYYIGLTIGMLLQSIIEIVK